MRGPAHAQNVFGLNNDYLLNTPKLQFENFIRFSFNVTRSVIDELEKYFPKGLGQEQLLGAYVKTATYPSMSIETDTLNQYNRKRIVQKKINYEPIQVTMHDIANGHTLKFWELYYNYYFKDGINAKKGVIADLASDPVVESGDYTKSSDFTRDNKNNAIIERDVTTHNDFGFNLHHADENLIGFIELFYSRGNKYNKVVLVNPKITSFKHDTLDYAGVANTMEMTFTIDYEYVVYGNYNYDFDVMSSGDLMDYPAPTMPSQFDPVTQAPSLSRDGVTASEGIETKPTDEGNAETNDRNNPGQSAGSQVGGLVGQELNRSITNVESGLDRIVDSIGGNVADSIIRGIQTGDFSLKPNPVDSAKSVFKNAGRNIESRVTNQARNFVGNAIQSSIDKGIKSIGDSINKLGQSGGGNGP